MLLVAAASSIALSGKGQIVEPSYVIRSGDPAGVFTSRPTIGFPISAQINASGDLLFRDHLGPFNHVPVLYALTDLGLQGVVSLVDLPPAGVPSPCQISVFGNDILTDIGTVVFSANGCGQPSSGSLFHWNGSGPAQPIFIDQSVNGSIIGYYPDAIQQRVSAIGDVSFIGRVQLPFTDDHCGLDSTANFIYSNGTIHEYLREGSAAPETSSILTAFAGEDSLCNAYSSGASDSTSMTRDGELIAMREVVDSGDYVGLCHIGCEKIGRIANRDLGIWRVSELSQSLVMRMPQTIPGPVPGLPTPNEYDGGFVVPANFVSPARVNAAGEIMIWGYYYFSTYDYKTFSDGAYALWQFDAGNNLKSVTTLPTHFPITTDPSGPSAEVYAVNGAGSGGNPQYTSVGLYNIYGTLPYTGTPPIQGATALYWLGNGTPELIVRTGLPAPGTDGEVFGSQSGPQLQFSVTDSGDALVQMVTDTGRRGLWMYDAGTGDLLPVLSVGDEIDLDPSPSSEQIRTITDFRFTHGDRNAGERTGLSEFGDVTAVVEFFDPGDLSPSSAVVVVRPRDLLCPADINGDNTASPADFTAWLQCFNNPASAPYCSRADVNLDGTITPADFTAWLAAFNDGCP